MKPVRIKPLADISVTAIMSEAAKNNHRITTDLEDLLISFVKDGVANIKTNGGQSKGSDQKLNAYEFQVGPESSQRQQQSQHTHAAENLQHLLQSTAEAAMARGTTTLDIEDFHKALSKLCPLPPWCK